MSSCSIFPERPSSYELESDKPVLPDIEHLKGKIGEGDFESLRTVLNRYADVFSKHKADIGRCNFVEHQIELVEGAVPHREGARRMTPHKSEECRMEIEMLLEYDMIESSKSPWACGVTMAKKKGAALVLLRFLLLERGDKKRRVPDNANRLKPLETWRRQFLHHSGKTTAGTSCSGKLLE